MTLLLRRGEGRTRKGVPMPTFIDRHDPRHLTAIPSAVRRQMHRERRNHVMDPNGVRAIGHWVEDGAIYCILDAPDADAACQHHADRGLPCDDLQVVIGLEERAPTSDNYQARVRAAIRWLWHSASMHGPG